VTVKVSDEVVADDQTLELTINVTGGAAIGLGDLDVAASRIPDWQPAADAEAGYAAAQSWTDYDVTCESSDGGCTAAAGTSKFPAAWGCDPANPADETGAATSDYTNINCMINAALDNTVLFFPAGEYEMGNLGNRAISITRSNIVLRGESPSVSILEATTAHDCGGGDFCLYSQQACGSSICGGAVISIGTSSFSGGTSTPWTAGYDEGDTVVTVTDDRSWDIDDWVLLKMTCPVLTPESGSNADALSHFAKITNVSGTGPYTLTIDRGLLMDYDSGSDGDRTGCPATATARPWAPVTNVGIERLSITSDDAIAWANLGTQDPIGLFGTGGVADSWLVNNSVGRTGKELGRNAWTARFWAFGNELWGVGSNEASFTHGWTPQKGSSETVFESNYFRDFRVAMMFQSGVNGAIAAYNLLLFGTIPQNVNDWSDRTLFTHGNYSRAILWEGNDTEGKLLMADVFWGRNGPRNTTYRNRIRGTLDTQGKGGLPNSMYASHSSFMHAIVTNHDSDNDTLKADRINIIGNTTGYMYSEVYANGAGSDFPQDVGYSIYHDVDSETTNMWIEKNAIRDGQTCTGDPSTLRCGLHIDSAEATTTCNGSVDCDTGIGDNEVGLGPITNVGDSIPSSLYRTAKPDWWCDEACSWTDPYSSIGAWGDAFCADEWDTGNPQTSCSYAPGGSSSCADKLCDSDPTKQWGLALCKLPAEIVLKDDGDCTCSGSYMRPDGSQWCGLGSA
jgi:hypothetical protein